MSRSSKEKEENHDTRLNLNLSLAPPLPETPPPSVSVPMQQHSQSQQGMAFSSSVQQFQQGMPFSSFQYSEAPPHFFIDPRVPIHYQQYYHSNQDQPSSSRLVPVPVPEVSLQDQYQQYHRNSQDQRLQDQFEAVNPMMMRQLYFSSITPPHHHPPPPPVETPEPEKPIQESSSHINDNEDDAGPSHRPRVPRRSRQQQIHGEGKSLEIPPPYPWAAPRRAHVRRLSELLSEGIHTITGRVQCKHCEEEYDMSFNLKNKFLEVANYIVKNKEGMSHRAPDVWMNPVLPDCEKCNQEKCVKPVIDKKRRTNWLFLLLGQMLGCCKLGHLKYCCKHTDNHRTGAKDRVLFLTYMALCKQLAPQGPFDVTT